MSLFHAPDGVVTLMFATDKWTRNDEGTVPCSRRHVADQNHRGIPATRSLQDPIQVLTGHGQNVSTGSACRGGDFEDKFVRTGD